MTAPADDTVTVQSTTDDGKPAVLMRWGRIEAVLTPETALTTARDLMAAASNAEADIALITTCRDVLQLNDGQLGLFLRDVRSRRSHTPGQTALRIEAVAGANTGLPYVHIARGSMKAQLDPDTARTMAQHWVETAVASQIDMRLRYALGEWDRLTVVEIDELFALIQKAQR